MEIITKKSLTRAKALKVQRDLEFISLFTKVAKDLGMRVVIHGGYSVDGALGTITKPHKDIDIQVYGNSENGKKVLQNLINSITTDQFDFQGVVIRDKGRSAFYHNFLAVKATFCADFYYIEVEGNPFDKEKIIFKDDGSKSESQLFRTHQASVNGFTFEATLPEDELNDKNSKKERADIDQDILNLERLLQK